MPFLDLFFEQRVDAQQLLRGIALGGDVSRGAQQADVAAGIDQTPAAIGEPAELVGTAVVDSVLQAQLAVALAFQCFADGADQQAAIVGMHPRKQVGRLETALIGRQPCHRLELGIPDQFLAADVVFPDADRGDLVGQADSLFGVEQGLTGAGAFIGAANALDHFTNQAEVGLTPAARLIAGEQQEGRPGGFLGQGGEQQALAGEVFMQGRMLAAGKQVVERDDGALLHVAA